ncbi:MAG: sulfatase-like hydrolase/transferase [Myxococcales bacterium]|nr:sulfatase [Myxococcales bacterium]HIL80708.1 sulfatase [Myxococcales bacterium]
MKTLTTWLAGIVTGLFLIVYLNFNDVATWAASKGMLGMLSELREPILANQVVAWQQGPASTDIPASERPPNIVVILVDDLGWNDISFYGGGLGNGAVQTPNIDAIANQGVHLTNGYTGNATCAPSRAALLTGRYPTRFGFEFTPAPLSFMRLTASMNDSDRPLHAEVYENRADQHPEYAAKGVAQSEIMLPKLLAENDYHSVALGKWHLGETEGQTPTERGFDEFLGFLSGGAAYAEFDDPEHIKSIQKFDPIDTFLWPNLRFAVRYNQQQRFTPDKYMTDYLTEHAVNVIEANRNRPFFVYLAYNAPHTPLHATKADYDALPMIENHTERVYGAMMLAVDRGVGQVMDALRENGLEENTLVIFTSDNGGAHYVGLPDVNAPYRGWKMTFFEGGIHTPYFVKWPAKLAAGGEYEQPASHIDIFATAAAAAGIELPSDRVYDGVDLMPYLTGDETGSPHDDLHWRSGGYSSSLSHGWKLQVSNPPGKVWLFNLNDDPTEQHNLADSEPEQLARMQTVMADAQKDWSEPGWPQFIAAPITVDKHLAQPVTADDEVVYWGN